MRKSTHTPEYGKLKERLLSLRTKAGLSQRQLAAVLRVPHSWVAKVESGERRIDLVEFAWFCSGCGAPAEVEAAELVRRWALPQGSGRLRAGGGRR